MDDLVIDLASANVRSEGPSQVVLIEFSDFQCPFCGQYARSTYSQLKTDFVDNGLVRYAFFNYPIERIHPLAMRAAEAAECAGAQEDFWRMHDALFASPSSLSEQSFSAHAQALQLDATTFDNCMDQGATKARILAQREEAAKGRVVSTPTFFVGRIEEHNRVRVTARIRGAAPYATFSGVLKQAMAAK